MVSILGLASYAVSVVTIQLCHCRMKTATDNIQNNNNNKKRKQHLLCYNKALFIKKQKQKQAVGHSLPTPVLDAQIPSAKIHLVY